MTGGLLMWPCAMVFGLLLSVWAAVRWFRPQTMVEGILWGYTVAIAHVVAWGYIVSMVGALASARAWGMAALGSASIWMLIVRFSMNELSLGEVGLKIKIGSLSMKQVPFMERLGLVGLGVSFIGTAVLNFIFALSMPPYVWDVLTYHMARVAYYLQQGHLSYFSANYWAQVVHPKFASIVLSFVMVVSRFSDSWTHLVQYFAYWAGILTVYYLARLSGATRLGSLYAAGFTGLLVSWLLEATTSQNDLLVTSMVGVSLVAFLLFERYREFRYWLWGWMAVALALGTKASAAIGLLAGCIVVGGWFVQRVDFHKVWGKKTLWHWLAPVVFAVVFVGISGYLDNWKRFGNPLGPASVVSRHSWVDIGWKERLRWGGLNVWRYGLDWISFDGIPPVVPGVQTAQRWVRWLPVAVARTLASNIESSDGVRAPFTLDRLPHLDADTAGWGILGFGWMVPVAGYFFIAYWRRHSLVWWLSFGGVLFWLIQSFIGPYDPWRNRYFILQALFWGPLVAHLFPVPKFRLYWISVLLMGILSSWSAVVLRTGTPLVDFAGHKAIWNMSREAKMAVSAPLYQWAFKAVAAHIPDCATIVVDFPPDSPEYPLFGQHLSRRVIPSRESKNWRKAPMYLVFSSKVREVKSDDIHLALDWYVRPLLANPVKCTDSKSLDVDS